MRDEFLAYGAPKIEESEIEEVVATLRSGWLSTGPRVKRFETEFSAYKGVNDGVAVSSCTAALHLSLIAAGIGPGDEVITTPFTFAASINAIIHAGGTPVLADIDPDTHNIDADQIKAKITPQTKAVLPVHYAGRACDMIEIMEIAEDHGLLVVEDCAHAIETEYHGQPAGTIGHFGCFSFYVTKNLVTGEGGFVLSKDTALLDRIRILALHGMSKDAWKRYSGAGKAVYEIVECGFKYNMMDIQAALGLHQLGRVDTYWERRKEIWERYNEAFNDLPIQCPAPVEEGTKHAHHLYTVLIDPDQAGFSRQVFISRLQEANVGTGVHYTAIPEHPYYQDQFGWSPDIAPVATQVGRQTVTLPLSAALTDNDVGDVIAAVRAAFGLGR